MGERRHVARMREELVSEINTVILLILKTSNSNGDSYEHNSSVALKLNAEADRTGKKHDTFCKQHQHGHVSTEENPH